MKQIPKYDNYYITREGRVYNKKYDRYLKPSPGANGYIRVCLSKQGKHTQFYIHRLVAEAFIPNPENKPEVNHKDENKANNNVDNLEWVTTKENINAGTVIERRAHTNGISVKCVETGEEYYSFAAAARANGIKDPKDIRRCCDNPRYTAKGYHWQLI